MLEQLEHGLGSMVGLGEDGDRGGVEDVGGKEGNGECGDVGMGVVGVVCVKIVAEFIDKPAVLARMKELGVDYGQGFLLHCPEPLERVLGKFARKQSA